MRNQERGVAERPRRQKESPAFILTSDVQGAEFDGSGGHAPLVVNTSDVDDLAFDIAFALS